MTWTVAAATPRPAIHVPSRAAGDAAEQHPDWGEQRGADDEDEKPAGDGGLAARGRR